MASTLPCKPRVKPEIENIQEPVILIPIDSSKFTGPLVPTGTPGSCPMVATKMVHVEKPKAENLQACSLAYLPVTPVYPKDGTGLQGTTSLVSCQAFECFSVLKSIMQASGYQVAAPQSQQASDLGSNLRGSVPGSFLPDRSRTVASSPGATLIQPPNQIQDSDSSPVNLVKPKQPDIFSFKAGVGRPKKRRRRASAKMEALNLCKRITIKPVVSCCSIASSINTKPIVSSSIANSIAELKVGNIRSSPKKPASEVAKNVSSVIKHGSCSTSYIPSIYDSTSLCKDSVSQPHPVEEILPVATTSGIKNENIGLESSINTTGLEDFPSKVDTDDDSSSSTNIDTSVIEQCAREMLEFINQKVEDVVLNTKPPIDFSNLKMQAGQCLLPSSRNKKKRSKDRAPVLRNVEDSKNQNNIQLEPGIDENEENRNEALDKGSVLKGKGVLNMNLGNENVKVVEKKIGTSAEDFDHKNVENMVENLGSKINALTKDIDDNNEENSDTLDADIKDDSSSDMGPKTFPDFENRLEILEGDSTKIIPLESCELSKDSTTEFAVSSPKPPELEEENEDATK